MKNLIDILPEKLKEGISPAEVRLLESAQMGDLADFRSGDKEIDKPEKADKWGNERIIRADLLYWSLINKEAVEYISAKWIQIIGAKIKGTLDFRSATLLRPLFLLSCAIEDIILIDSHLPIIDLSGSFIESLIGDALTTTGSVLMKKIITKNEIRLIGATIGDSLVCDESIFENTNGYAFSADRLTTKGNVSLINVTTHSEIRLLGATIGGNLDCEKVNTKGLIMERVKINGCLVMIGSKGAINLSNARAGQLMDDENSWPGQDKLNLRGFEYKGFAGGNTPTEANKRIKWIRLQTKEPFSTQPYEHLAKVYRQIGHESDAKEVLIAKYEDLRKYGSLSILEKCWNWFLGETIGHGYKSIRLFLFILLFLLLGVYLFDWADNLKVMQPSKERVYMSKEFIEKRYIPPEYPQFNSIIYSIDTLVPFLDLHQEDYWLPDASKPYGFGFRIYFWVHIIFGWISSTLAVVYLTGLIRKE